MSEVIMRPTLWRSCRVLANERRLRLLKSVLDQGALSVNEAAQKNKLPLSIASAYLRHLNARGFLRVARHGSHVYYTVGFDPLVQHSEILLKSICEAIQSCSTHREFQRVIQIVTTCTCPRRIKLVRSIACIADVEYETLRRETGMSKTALNRQLGKLLRRHVIQEHDEKYRLAPLRDPLLAQLVHVCVDDVREEGCGVSSRVGESIF